MERFYVINLYIFLLHPCMYVCVAYNENHALKNEGEDEEGVN